MDNPFDDPPPPPPQPVLPTGPVNAAAPAGLEGIVVEDASQPPAGLTGPTTLGAPVIGPNGLPTTQAIQPVEIPRLPPIEHSDWDKTRLDLMLILASEKPQTQKANNVIEALVSLSDQYESEAALYLSVLSGVGYPVSGEAREVIFSDQRAAPSQLYALEEYRMSMASRAGSGGEASLRALQLLTKVQPISGQRVSYVESLSTLVENGLTQAAKDIAFETLAPWAKS
jgi:hypothetical protein